MFNNFFRGLVKTVMGHKLIAAIIVLLIIGGGYWGYHKLNSGASAMRYIFAQVERGTLVVSLSATGEVTSLETSDVKSKVSSTVTSVAIKEGETVKSGDLLVRLDSATALAKVKSAKLSLDKERFALQQLEVRSGGSISAKAEAEEELKNAYWDGLDGAETAFSVLAEITTSTKEVLFGSNRSNLASRSTGQWNIDYYADAAKEYDQNIVSLKDQLLAGYNRFIESYSANEKSYQIISRLSDFETMGKAVNLAYDSSVELAQLLNDTENYLKTYQKILKDNEDEEPIALSDIQLNSLNAYQATVAGQTSTLLGLMNTIKSAKGSVANANFDITTQQLAVEEAEQALADAQEAAGEYSFYAPYSGTVTAVNVENGDSVSSGTTLVSLIADEQIVKLSLSEVDVAKIKPGQKATLTLDALPDLTLTGRVALIDAVGASSQGVVTYTVQLAFDFQDKQVKPGMSVTAEIITDAKTDILLIGSAAIKTQEGVNYVEVATNVEDIANIETRNGTVTSLVGALEKKIIETGISNDELTEIASGVSEGDWVFVRNSNSAASSSTTGTTSNSQNKQGSFESGPGSIIRF